MNAHTEQLDELLAMATSLGHQEAQATAAEHRADMAPMGSTARPRREARALRKRAEQAARMLAAMRTRFLRNTGGLK